MTECVSFCVAGAVKKWNGKATEHDISRAVGDHLKPLVEPGVVFTTPPRWKSGIDPFVSVFAVVESFHMGLILIFILRGIKSLSIGRSLGSFVEIKSSFICTAHFRHECNTMASQEKNK
jgi:hypothetical protein